jgi:hypothetical protein
MQARSVSAHDLCNLSPGPRLPDDEILVPKRRTAAKLRGISRQQLGERVKRSANGHVGLDPKNRHVGSRLLIVTLLLGKQPCGFRMRPLHYNGSEVLQVPA